MIKNITIPKSVEKLKLNCCDNQYIIDNLSNNIKELHILSCYDLNLDNLPNSITKLYIEEYFELLNNLPNSIEYLEINIYNLKIKKIPKNIKTIKCDRDYKYIDDFKDYEVITY